MAAAALQAATLSPSTQHSRHVMLPCCCAAVFLAAGEATASTGAKVGNHTAQDARKGGVISTQRVGLICRAAGYDVFWAHTHAESQSLLLFAQIIGAATSQQRPPSCSHDACCSTCNSKYDIPSFAALACTAPAGVPVHQHYQVLELLNHINKRVKALPTTALPLLPLVRLW